jgi:hypothetical protein
MKKEVKNWTEKEELMRKSIEKYLAESENEAAVLVMFDKNFRSDVISYGEPGTLFERLVDMFTTEIVPAAHAMFFDRLKRGGNA